MTNTDAYLEIQRRLRPDDAAAFMAAVTRADPHLVGAHVADVLQMYDEADALLQLREAFSDQHLDRFPGVRLNLYRAAVIVAAVCRPNDMLPFVMQLLRPEPAPACAICGKADADHLTPKGAWIHIDCGVRQWNTQLQKSGHDRRDR
jgi:alkylation response protein AidB-like acyl-CoA dehydrogenase